MRKKNRQYPSSVEEVLDDTIKYRREVIRAMNSYKDMKPWEGTPFQKAAKMFWLHLQLCEIYGANTSITFDPAILCGRESKTGNGWCDFQIDNIHIIGRVSVLTFLHEWGHRLHGESEHLACWWSINLFRKIFPGSFNKLLENANGHFLAAG